MSSKAIFDFIEKKKDYHARKWHSYVDCINEEIRKYLGNQPLEEHLSSA